MIEKGERPATPELAEQIASLLKVKKEDIFLPQSFTVRETMENAFNGEDAASFEQAC